MPSIGYSKWGQGLKKGVYSPSRPPLDGLALTPVAGPPSRGRTSASAAEPPPEIPPCWTTPGAFSSCPVYSTSFFRPLPFFGGPTYPRAWLLLGWFLKGEGTPSRFWWSGKQVNIHCRDLEGLCKSLLGGKGTFCGSSCPPDSELLRLLRNQI